MKRHSSLAILSREHHGALILAQLLKKGAPAYKGLPVEPDGKADYALKFYQDNLVKHFADEEQVIIKRIKGIHPELDRLASEIVREHTELNGLFTGIKAAPDLAAHLDKLGGALEQHIRKEERVFFPLLQEVGSEELLAGIEQALTL
jgi:iron-sulfur cluster repair protein YtfE (RIC family)